MRLQDKITELIEPILISNQMELVAVECLRMGSRWLIRVYIDKEGGITLQDCTDMSHLLGDVLEVNDLPQDPFTLEISSPGINRNLTRDKDFVKYRGSGVRVKLSEKLDGIKNFHGFLRDYIEENDEKFLILEMNGKTYRIPRDLVVKANLEMEPLPSHSKRR